MTKNHNWSYSHNISWRIQGQGLNEKRGILLMLFGSVIPQERPANDQPELYNEKKGGTGIHHIMKYEPKTSGTQRIILTRYKPLFRITLRYSAGSLFCPNCRYPSTVIHSSTIKNDQKHKNTLPRKDTKFLEEERKYNDISKYHMEKILKDISKILIFECPSNAPSTTTYHQMLLFTIVFD